MGKSRCRLPLRWSKSDQPMTRLFLAYTDSQSLSGNTKELAHFSSSGGRHDWSDAYGRTESNPQLLRVV